MGKTFSPANIKRFYTNDDVGCKFEMDKDALIFITLVYILANVKGV